MAKRKKHLRLPSGYGQIRYLGKGRRKCYAVHPPAVADPEAGAFVRQKALCYVDNWYTGFAVLAAYHNGTYKPGDELAMPKPSDGSKSDSECTSILALIQSKLAEAQAQSETGERPAGKTFADVYAAFYEWKFGEHAAKVLSDSSKAAVASAYKNLAPLHEMLFADIRVDDMQRVLDSCPLKKASLEHMVSLLHQLYKYADARELCAKDYSKHIVIPNAEDDEHGVPFTEDELAAMWAQKDDTTVEMILIMCYSGFRIRAYTSMETDLDEKFFKGGVKTKAGKGRVVPIHSAILPLVCRRLSSCGAYLPQGCAAFRYEMRKTMKRFGFDTSHTPHDCRHTFSFLCERYGVSENDRKRMLGHSFGNDITNGIYGHRSLEDLRAEIEKIRVPSGVVTSM